MRAILLILTAGSVLTLYRLDNSSTSGSGSAPAPGIEITCSMQSVHDAPEDEPDIYAIVRFKWKATNASYVLVKGHDDQRHPSQGSFDKTNGGAFTFIAVSGDQRIRKPWMCTSKYRIGTGVHGKIWDVIEKPNVAIDAASEFKITTSLSKQELQDRIVQVVRTASDVVLVPTNLSENSFGLSSDGYADNKRLCEVDSCRKSGVDIKRQIAFDILAEIESKIGSDTEYRIRITPDVLFRVIKEGAEWYVDPNSDEIAKPILKELAENIAKLKK